MNKILITSGCSFTESDYTWKNPTDYGVTQTWAFHLGKHVEGLQYDFINKAMGSQGNGLISRGIIYQVCEELKTRSCDDILVGVMWSGVSRYDYRCESPELTDFSINKVYNGWMENPTGFIEGYKKWVILNHHWANANEKGKINQEAELYYKNFHDMVGSYIYSLEHMLRVQYFLKAKNIKYFFTIYQDHVLDPKFMNLPEIKHLYDLLDKSHFLPVTSEYTWCVESKIDLKHWILPHPYNHPSSIHHKSFVDQIILPWLKTKNYL